MGDDEESLALALRLMEEEEQYFAAQQAAVVPESGDPATPMPTRSHSRYARKLGAD